ncbi:MAG: type II secretion system protein GspL [Hyphomonas sp.]
MANEVFVALPEDPGAPLEILRERSGQLEAVAPPFLPGKAGKVVAFAPATRIAHFCLPMPSRSESEALLAAPFAIEDDLAQPVEEVHLALGPRRKESGLRDVYTADRALLKAWIDQLDAAGLTEASIIPEQSLLDGEAGDIRFASHTLLRQGDRVLCVDARLPDILRDALLPEVTAPAITVENRLAWLAGRHTTRPGINLRTAGYTAKRKEDSGYRAWTVTAGLALAALGLWTAAQFAEGFQRSAAARSLDQQAAQTYAQLFPGAPVPANLDSATRQMLGAHSGAQGLTFREAATALYEALAVTPDTHLTALSFDGRENALHASIVFASAEAAPSLLAALGRSGYAVEAAGDLQPSGDGLTGQIRIGARP